MIENHQNKSIPGDSIRLRIFLPTLTSLLLGTQFGCNNVDAKKFLHKNNLKQHIPSAPLSPKRTRIEAKRLDAMRQPENGGSNGGGGGSGGSSCSPTFTSSSSTASPNVTAALPKEPLVASDLQTPLKNNERKADSITNAEEHNTQKQKIAPLSPEDSDDEFKFPEPPSNSYLNSNITTQNVGLKQKIINLIPDKSVSTTKPSKGQGDNHKDTANNKPYQVIDSTLRRGSGDLTITRTVEGHVNVLEQIKRFASREENKSNTEGGSSNPSTLPKEFQSKENSGNRKQHLEQIQKGVILKKVAKVKQLETLPSTSKELPRSLVDRVPFIPYEEDTEPNRNDSGPERNDSEWED